MGLRIGNMHETITAVQAINISITPKVSLHLYPVLCVCGTLNLRSASLSTFFSGHYSIVDCRHCVELQVPRVYSSCITKLYTHEQQLLSSSSPPSLSGIILLPASMSLPILDTFIIYVGS